MASKNHPVKPTMKIPIDFIDVNHDFNVRKVVYNEKKDVEEYEDIESLAKQIKNDGQLSPVMVRRIPEEDIKEYGGKTFELIFGFRRLAAIKFLEQDTVMAQIWDGTEEDAYFVNLAENVSRKNLTPWEKGKRYAELKADYGMSGRQIAARLGESSGHVNNLIRVVEEGNPKIIELWKNRDGKATTDGLIKYVILKGSSHDEQWENWLKHCGLLPDDDEEEEEKPPKETKEKGPSRPGAKYLENGLVAVKECESKSDDWLAGCQAALKWALGKTKTLPGVYDPRKKPPREDDLAA